MIEDRREFVNKGTGNIYIVYCNTSNRYGTYEIYKLIETIEGSQEYISAIGFASWGNDGWSEGVRTKERCKTVTDLKEIYLLITRNVLPNIKRMLKDDVYPHAKNVKVNRKCLFDEDVMFVELGLKGEE